MNLERKLSLVHLNHGMLLNNLYLPVLQSEPRAEEEKTFLAEITCLESLCLQLRTLGFFDPSEY